MEKANKKAMYESLLLHEMFNNELNAMGTDIGYSRYHSNCAEGLRYLSDKYNQILGYTGTTTDDFVNFISASVFVIPCFTLNIIFAICSEPCYSRFFIK